MISTISLIGCASYLPAIRGITSLPKLVESPITLLYEFLVIRSYTTFWIKSADLN